ncbi:TetR/AcrR family transcriptional regulator, partial [Nocardia abscessus]|uniref:TetR/AcrR family transcriptional regulator n=1 Tax=Nocardia abscessus TaxID=120957 RepID=UPI002454DF7D
MTAPSRRRGRPPAAESTASDTRERIVRAAIDLFAEKGFHGTGVAEIGERADVQRGALYYHIGSKEELLWQILRDYIQRMLADAEQIADGPDDPVTKLRRLIHSYVRLIIRHQREVAIQLRDVRARTRHPPPQTDGKRRPEPPGVHPDKARPDAQKTRPS